MPAITTQDLRISNADLFDKLVTENSTYVALSHTSEWDDEQLPPDVFDCIEDRVLSYKELVGMKKLLATITKIANKNITSLTALKRLKVLPV